VRGCVRSWERDQDRLCPHRITVSCSAASAPNSRAALRCAVLCCALQVDKDMIEVLQATWLDGHLAALREEGRKYEK